MTHALRAEAEAAYPLHTVERTDHKAWAKRIMYRYERGARDLSPIQVDFAHEALGIEKQKEE